MAEIFMLGVKKNIGNMFLCYLKTFLNCTKDVTSTALLG